MATSASPKKNAHASTLELVDTVFCKLSGWLAVYPSSEDAALQAPSSTVSNYLIGVKHAYSRNVSAHKRFQQNMSCVASK